MGRGKNRFRLTVIIAAAALAVIMLFYLRLVSDRIQFCTGGDQPSYLVTALALSQGQGYKDISLTPPAVHTHRPFLFPLLLAAIIKTAGIHIPAMKTVILAMYLAGAFFFFDILRRRGYEIQAGIAVILTLSFPFFVEFSTFILSELPYIGLSFAALWATEMAAVREKSRPWRAAALVLMALAFFMRSIGLAVGAAMVAAFFLDARIKESRGRKIRAVITASVLAACALGWWGWGYYHDPRSGIGYAYELVGVNPLNHGEVKTFDQLILTWKDNALFYLYFMSNIINPLGSKMGALSLALGVLSTLLVLFGYVADLRRGRSAFELYPIFYIPFILLWSHPNHRFLLPLTPYIFYYLIRSVERLADIGFSSETLPAKAIVGGAAAILAGLHFTASYRTAELERKELPAVVINENFKMEARIPEDLPIMNLALWSRKNITAEGRFLSHFRYYMYLISRHPNVEGQDFWKEDPLQFMIDNRVDYVTTAEAFPAFSKRVEKAIDAAPQRFIKVAGIEGTNTVLYRFDHGGAGSFPPLNRDAVLKRTDR